MKKLLDPIILLVALLLLAIVAGLLAYYYPTVQQITGESSNGPSGQSIKPLKADEVAASLAPWSTPAIWEAPASKARLFQSDDFLFYPAAYADGKGHDYIKKVGPETRSPSGIPLGWYSKYGLNVTDGAVDREDADGDGFSNMTEFKNEPVGVRYKAEELDGTKSTNPLDPKDHPDYLARLRLSKYELRPFHIKFVGYQQLNGTTLFQLYLQNVPPQNQPPLKKSGDELGFEGYKIGAFHETFEDIKDPATGAVVHTNTSTLDLVKPEIDLTVSIPFRKEIDSPESTANFVMLMPNDVDKVIKISRGKTFKILPYLPDNSYLVISADDKGAKIRDTKTGKDYDILKLIDTEWNEVPLPPPAQH